MTTPTLTGSPKQIDWATDIRDTVVANLQLAERVGLPAEAATKTIEWLDTHTEARWWIDNLRDVQPIHIYVHPADADGNGGGDNPSDVKSARLAVNNLGLRCARIAKEEMAR